MSTPNPDPENEMPLREALLRDAARVGEPPFDAALHHAAMRRIRALSAEKQPRLVWRWALASAAAVLLLLGIVALRDTGPAAPAVAEEGSARAAIVEQPGTGLAWTYQRAAMEGDDALQSMLDRDARTLLAASASAFSTPLP
jgi:hypothetical protein